MELCFECQQSLGQQICQLCPKYFHQKCFLRPFSDSIRQVPSPTQQNMICYYCSIRKQQLCRICLLKTGQKSQQTSCKSLSENLQEIVPKSKGFLKQIHSNSSHTLSKAYTVLNKDICKHGKSDRSKTQTVKCTVCLCKFHIKCIFQESLWQQFHQFDLLKQLGSYVCDFCVSSFGITHLKSDENSGNQSDLCLVKVNHPSPLSWAWVPRSKICTFINKTRFFDEYNMQPYMPVRETYKHKKKSNQIQKIISLRWTETAQIATQRFPEEYIDCFLSQVGQYFDQERALDTENFGEIGNMSFLVKWQGVPWSKCCWEDEAVVKLYPTCVFQYFFTLNDPNYSSLITDKLLKKMHKIIEKQSIVWESEHDRQLCSLLAEHFQDSFSQQRDKIDILDLNINNILPEKSHNPQQIHSYKSILSESYLAYLTPKHHNTKFINIIVTIPEFAKTWQKGIKKIMPFSNTLCITEKIKHSCGLEILSRFLFRNQDQECKPVFTLLVLAYDVYQQLNTEKVFQRFWKSSPNDQFGIQSIIFDEFSNPKLQFMPQHPTQTKYLFISNAAQRCLQANRVKKSNIQQIVIQLPKIFKQTKMVIIHDDQTELIASCLQSSDQIIILYDNQQENTEENGFHLADPSIAQNNCKSLSKIVSLIFHQFVHAFGFNLFSSGNIRRYLIKFQPKYSNDLKAVSQKQLNQHLNRYIKTLHLYKEQKKLPQNYHQYYFCQQRQVVGLFKHICDLDRLYRFHREFKNKANKQMFNCYLVEVAKKLLISPFLLFLIICYILKYGYGQRSFAKIYHLKNWEKPLQNSKRSLINWKATNKNFGHYLFDEIKNMSNDGHHKQSRQNLVKRYMNTCYVEVIKYLNSNSTSK